MIDIDVSVDAHFFKRWMTVARMRSILSQLPDDANLIPNRAGNLSVSQNGECLGWIDFNEERLETYAQTFSRQVAP